MLFLIKTKTTVNNPEIPKPFYLFTVSHQTTYFFQSKLLYLFIISSEMGYLSIISIHTAWSGSLQQTNVTLIKVFGSLQYITKTRLFKYLENFTTKNWNFLDKHSDIFHISAQNIDCGYSLEPPRRGSSNEYPQAMILSRNKKNNVYPCKPEFYYINMGFKGVYII